MRLQCVTILRKRKQKIVRERVIEMQTNQMSAGSVFVNLKNHNWNHGSYSMNEIEWLAIKPILEREGKELINHDWGKGKYHLTEAEWENIKPMLEREVNWTKAKTKELEKALLRKVLEE